MKTQYFNFLFLVLMLPALSLASNNTLKGRYTKEKKIEKTFTVNADASLKIDNSYGNVNITSWNENRTVIVVVIKTNGNDEEEVAKKLDEIDVLFEASANYVSAETKFNKYKKRSWWNSWGGNDKVNMEITYTVKVPVTNAIDISNDYGAIILNKIEGNARLSCDYGRLEIGELMADNNLLNFDYTNNSNIGYMRSGRINADYSGFTLEEAEEVELRADYSKSVFGKVKRLDYTCDYGSMTAENTGHVSGRGDYLSVRLGNVSGDVDLTADYGSIKIDRLTPKAGDVTITSDYAGIKLGYDSSYNFSFVVDLEYGGINGEEDLEVTKRRVESSDKYFEGYYGAKNSGNQINIRSEYGGVSFIKK
ncbi:hypothetical protein [Croceiramulus getboli]|nr:hypothetical protein P8624_11180 [Flavobacteriaceae bacterium YJPT1-3]